MTQADRYRVAAGAALLLVGVAALLPWLVEALVRRVRGPGVAGQLAIRRLQLSPETSARMVSGVAVAAAGAIALQMLFAGVGDDYRRARSADALPAQVELDGPGVARLGLAGTEAALAAAPGVGAVHVQQLLPIVVPVDGAPPASLLVGTCATLQAALPLPRCADGDVFVVASDAPFSETGIPRPGQEVAVGDAGSAGGTAGLPRWTVPAGAVRVADVNGVPASVLATPAAVPAALLRDAMLQAAVELVPGASDAADELRTAAARVDPTASVFVPAEAQEDHRFAGIRRGIYLGVAATLALIGASMLVALLESLRERRRSLAVLVAFGTPTRTLGWSGAGAGRAARRPRAGARRGRRRRARRPPAEHGQPPRDARRGQHRRRLRDRRRRRPRRDRPRPARPLAPRPARRPADGVMALAPHPRRVPPARPRAAAWLVHVVAGLAAAGAALAFVAALS